MKRLSFRIQVAVGALLLARQASREIRQAAKEQQREQEQRVEAGYL